MKPIRQTLRTSRRSLMALVAGATLSVTTHTTFAQPPSDKAIRIIVSAPAGGTSDFLARIVSEGIAKGLGQPVVVDNKPGGLGAIAMDSYLSAPRDSLTYLVSASALFSEVPYTLKPKYDPLKDVKPLVELADGGLVLVGNPALPPKTMAELVSYVKANPGKVNFASFSPGTQSHVLGLQLNKAAGLDMQHIGYKGSPPALQDVMGGQVQFMFDGLTTSLPNIKAGKLRAFAVTSPQRSPLLPDVPTVAELGFPELTQTTWVALWTTPDVPTAAQQRVRDETLKALAAPGVKERLANLGLTVSATPPTPEQMAAKLSAHHKAMGDTLKAMNYRPE